MSRLVVRLVSGTFSGTDDEFGACVQLHGFLSEILGSGLQKLSLYGGMQLLFCIVESLKVSISAGYIGETNN
jgi:hypothetical protein